MSPGATVVLPSVTVTDRSAVASGVSVSVSVATLLPRMGSDIAAGANTVTMLLIVPVAFGSITPIKLKVTLALAGRFTKAFRVAKPLVGPETLPPLLKPVTPQVTLVRPANGWPKTLAPVRSSGPLLVTVIV
jgi:hypothetical protein